MTYGDGSPDETSIIRRHPTGSFPALSDDSVASPSNSDADPQTSIIRRLPTGSFPALAEPSNDEAATGLLRPVGAPDDPATTYVPRATPMPVPGTTKPNPTSACATATAGIISGWATAVIASSLIAGWWRTDQLFCVAVGFLTAVSAAATIGGLISLLLRRRIGRLLIVVGSVVALMIFAGLFVAGAELPPIVYGIPVLPVASVVLALLPATGRWCRP